MLSLIPISDANPTRRFPVVTVTLIVLNVVAFLVIEPGFGQTSQAQTYFLKHAPAPCQLHQECPAAIGTGGRVVRVPQRDILSLLGAILFSTFLHAGLLHIAGNMLFLWIFGNNVEDYLGRVSYTVFYGLGGLAAGFAQIISHLGPCSNANLEPCIPSVGASGAVAAVMGAYFLLFPRARIRVFVMFFIITMLRLSAWVVLGLWFLFQIIVPQPGVAWQAHVGGFLFGLVAVFLWGGRPQQPQPVALRPGWR